MEFRDTDRAQSALATGGVNPDPAARCFAGFLASMLIRSDQETIWSLACEYFRTLGFTNVLYGYSPDSRGAALGAPDDYLILSTLPHAVVEDMVHNTHYRHSSTFVWALNNIGIAPFSMSYEECGLPADTPPSPDAEAFFLRHGMLSGCSIGFPPERARGRAVMALIGDQSLPQATVDRLAVEAGEMIFTVAAVAHRCLCSLPFQSQGRSLTNRQREVLEWVAEGKTSADIALIMGISMPTVDKHLRLAREALGVETTAHALVKATFLNQVFAVKPGSITAQFPSSPNA